MLGLSMASRCVIACALLPDRFVYVFKSVMLETLLLKLLTGTRLSNTYRALEMVAKLVDDKKMESHAGRAKRMTIKNKATKERGLRVNLARVYKD